MDISIFLAQFWGWFTIITAVIYILGGNSLFDRLMKIHEDKGFVFLSGWILLPLGLITIILHNVWVSDWRIVITVAGWLITLMAIVRIGFPGVTQKIIASVLGNNIMRFRIAVIIAGGLGIWLLFMSL